MPTQHHSETEPSPTRSENEVEEEEEEEEEEEGEEEEGEEEEEEADYEDDELEIGESYSDKDNMNDDNDDNDDDEDTVAVDAAADEEIEEEDNADDNEDDDEYVVVNLATIREEMQCPICLGIIRKTRTVMECLHRFCRDCIDKSMRLGNNECPACRTHCASRRSLRDDPNYDALIAALYPDIDKYEEEELALHEEEERRNKQIQASIADTFRRQSEAITRRRRSAKATAAAFVRKANSKFCGIPGQSRANNRVSTRSKRTRKGSATEGEIQKQYSDAEETEQTRWHRKRRKASSSLHENSFDLDEAEEDNNEGSGDSQAEASRGSTDASPGNARKTRLAWGKGGARSHMKYASVRGSHSRNNRTTYATKMVDHILNKKYEEDESKFDIHFMLQPYENEENIPSLKRPYLCCPPTLTVKHICKFLSRFSSISPEDIEIVLEKQSGLLNASQHSKLFQCQGKLAKGKSVFGVSTSENFFGVLNQDRTLAEIFVACPEFKGNMVLMYRTKE